MADTTAARAAFEELTTALNHLQIARYMDVVSAAVVVYDVITKLDVEIEHIWTKKWTFLTVVYLVQRYLPVFDTTIMILFRHFGTDYSHRACLLNYHIVSWSSLVGIVLSQFILTLRVWAVWKTSTRVAIGFSIFFLGCWVPCYVFLAEILGGMQFGPDPFPNYPGCFPTGEGLFLHTGWVLFWALWLVYDTGTFVMILIPGATAYCRGGRSELIQTIYQDGVIYYVFMFLISLINVICNLTLPVDFSALLSQFERVIHSLLTSHVILHIRQVAWKRSLTEYQSISEIRFTRETQPFSGLGPEQSTTTTSR